MLVAILLTSLSQWGCTGLTSSGNSSTKNSTGSTSANPPPSISTQPASQTIAAGHTATFSVVASDTSTLTYQWTKNGTAISGATSSTYTTSAATSSENGTLFTVVVSTSTNKVTSDAATLTVSTVPMAITVNPANATLTIGSSQQFFGNVTGASNAALTWTVSGVGCTGTSCGTISSVGLYIPPATVPSPAIVDVNATSMADPTKSGSAKVTIVAVASVLLSISPLSSNVPTLGTQLFTAIITGTSNTAVSWRVSSSGCSGSSCGTLSTSALSAVYSAPPIAPPQAHVNVIATSIADPTKSASADVTIVPTPVVTVTPAKVSVAAGSPQQFVSSVTGISNTAVTWAVNGIIGGSSTFGVISPTGTYTAPASIPNPDKVTVTAASAAPYAATGSSTVTLTNPASAEKGGPVLNVSAYGATVNDNKDATAAINRTIAALPPSGGTVYLSSGIYAIKSPTSVITISKANVSFICAPGGILQAQTGFQGNYPEIDIIGSATDVLVQGCVFDGNNISGQGFQIDGSAAQVVIDSVESKNQTGNAGRGSLRTGGLVQITNSYFHNDTGGYYDLAGIGGAPSLRFDMNHCDVITGNPDGICSGSSGLNFFEASNNQFTNITAGKEAVLYCFGCDKVDWQHNSFNNVSAAVHCDTCGGGTVSFNTATNDMAVGFPDYFVEVSSNFTIEGNVSLNKKGERGMVLGVGSTSQSPASLRTQVSSFDSTIGFTAGSNVVVSTDSVDKQEGTGSMVATANGSFTAGTLWYFNFGSPQTFWVPYQDIWIKPTSGALIAGQLQLCLSLNKAISTCDLPVNLPAIGQNSWFRVIAYATGWEGALSINGQGSSGFNSFGIKVTNSSPGLVVKFDDFDRSDELLGYVARSNNIVNPASACISFGALQGGILADNDCQNPISGANSAYIDANSAGVTFSGNKSSFTTNVSGTVHLLVDAQASAANVIASGDVTNATTEFSSTNGGKINLAP